MADNWPITAADLRKALGFKDEQEVDEAELALFATAACQKIDDRTGRNTQSTRHEIEGNLPIIFILAARETAKLWWNQSKNGPRGSAADNQPGPPAGAAMPRKVEAWLEDYPPPPGFGQPVSE